MRFFLDDAVRFAFLVLELVMVSLYLMYYCVVIRDIEEAVLACDRFKLDIREAEFHM